MDIWTRLRAEPEAFDVKLFEIGGTSVTLVTLAVLVVILIVTWLLSNAIQRGMDRGFKMRGVQDEGTVGVSKRLSHYVVMTIGLGIGLQTVGINLSALFAAGAVFAIGVGFAMQNLAKNFVGGVILLLEGSIRPGTILTVDERLVKVRELRMRATIARTLDEEDLIIPNANIVEATVKSYTLGDTLFRLHCPVGVVYGSDMDRVAAALEQAAREVPWRVQAKEPLVLLTGFGSSSVDWDVCVWIDDPWAMKRRLSELHKTIWSALKEADITIAFPQVDVHFDPPVMDAVERQRLAS